MVPEQKAHSPVFRLQPPGLCSEEPPGPPHQQLSHWKAEVSSTWFVGWKLLARWAPEVQTWMKADDTPYPRAASQKKQFAWTGVWFLIWGVQGLKAFCSVWKQTKPKLFSPGHFQRIVKDFKTCIFPIPYSQWEDALPFHPHSGAWLFLSFFFFFKIQPYFLKFIYFNWRPITPQYCNGFCRTPTRTSHECTCVPHPEPRSHLPSHPIPQGRPHALALSALLHASNLDWWSVSHMVICMFQCYSLKSSHPHLLPQMGHDFLSNC